MPQFPLAILQTLLKNLELLFLHGRYPTEDSR
jgi:hypothetical protein